MIQPSSCDYVGEAFGLVTASASRVESARSPEFGIDENDGLFKKVVILQVEDERGKCVIEILDQQMLLELPGVVGVPTRAVLKIIAIGNLNETDARLKEAPRKEATLSEFASIGIAQVGRFGFQIEGLHKSGSGKTDALLQGSVIFGELFILGKSLLTALAYFFQKLLPSGISEGGKQFWPSQTGGAGL